MIRFVFYVNEWMNNSSTFQPLILFVAFVWFVWLVKFLVSSLYKPYKGETLYKASVIIPILNETPHLLEKCLESIKNCNPNQIIAVFDSKDNNESIELVHKYADTVLKASEEGKRENVSLGIQHAKNDIIVLIDSDTILEESAIDNILKPFNDPKIGGVVGRHRIYEFNKTMTSRVCNWMENMRFNLTVAAESVFGQVGCMPGRLVAYRKEIVEDNINDFLVQMFLGVQCKNGDDRCLTSIVLSNNYKTIYQSTAVAYTLAPTSIKGFFRQQVRWARGSYRGYFLSLKWVYKKPFLMFCSTSVIIMPFLLVYVILYSIYLSVNGEDVLNIPIGYSVLLSFVSMTISKFPRQYPHLKEIWTDVQYLPIYVLYTAVLLLLARFAGVITIRKNDWLTR